MKKILYTIFVLALSVSMQAQVDRSVQPKPGPSPKINLGKPQSFQLPNGLTVLVVENHKLPRVSMSLTLDNKPDLEGNKKGISSLTSSLIGNGTSKISKDDFNKKIDFYGAGVYLGINGFSANTLSRYFPEILKLAADGSLDPVFTQADLDSEKAKLIDGIKSGEKSTQSIASRVRGALIYGLDHPRGEFEKEEVINSLTLDDVKKYYKENFVPTNAYLVIVGDVKFGDVKKLVTENFSAWKKATPPVTNYKEPMNLKSTEINFVDVPSALQTSVFVSNIVTLKMTDPDYFAALLANQVLGGGGEGRLFNNLREAHGWTYGSYSSVGSGKYTSDFTASAEVRSVATDSAIVEILKEIDSIRTIPVKQDELDLAKAKYIGNFVMNAEKPETIAGFALREKTQNLPATFYADYIKNINSVTLAQVQAAAKKYFSHDDARIIVVGKGSDVLEGLERLNIPIKYYDKYANPTTKPEIAQVDASVTPQAVLKKYIAAIGGEKAVSEIKSVAITTNASIQGQEMTTVAKQTADGKSASTVTMMGRTVMKTVFDGTKGYAEMQGQKRDLEGEQLDALKEGIIPELNLLTSTDIKIAGIEKINDSDAYKLVSGKKSYFYDLKSGLKVAEETTASTPQGDMTQRVVLSDYKDVKGVKFPFVQSTNMMGMDLTMNVTDLKVNEGVTDADFK